MNPKARNILSGVAIAILIISDVALVLSNLRLRDELSVANRTIVKLQKNAFNDDIKVSDSTATPEIVLYNRQPSGSTSAGNDHLNSVQPLGSNSTPGISLLDLKSKYLGKAAQSEFTLFVFFSPTDCPACLQEAPIWQKLQGLNLQVVGIMNHPHKLEGEQFLKQLNVTFPVLIDSTAFLKNKYMIGETPEKILIDAHGKTLLITPGSKTEEEKRAFEESVLKIIKGKSTQ